MGRYILILGIVQRNIIGGVVDIERSDHDDAGKVLVIGIMKALAEKKTNSGGIYGFADCASEACASLEAFEPMPFTGTIEDTVCLWIE